MSQAAVKVSQAWMRTAERLRRIDSVRGSLNLQQDIGDPAAQQVYCASFEAPIGVIYIASTAKGVCKIALPKDGKSSFFSWVKTNFSLEGIVDDRKRNSVAVKQLNEYFIGKRTKFDLDIDLIGTPFQQRVWTEIARTPYGRITTYKQIAGRIHTKGYRAVGATVGKNPLPIIIPCHRVIGSDSKLTGYAGGIRLKEFLLRLEGVILV
ncbi:MAG TPA: methylated-DNA--[protein]-cysteine S-methyltransferase [Candidatus Kryptonia bacterium]